MPEEVINEVRLQGSVIRPQAQPRARLVAGEVDGTDLKLGQPVLHAKFGEGVVLDCEGKGSSARVQVHFESAGSKWLVLAYAKLNVIA